MGEGVYPPFDLALSTLPPFQTMMLPGRLVLLSILSSLLLSSCCFMPKTLESEFHAGVPPCELKTKKLTLEVLQPEGGMELTEAMLHACDGNNTGPECVIVVLAPAAVSLGSLIVSGSIVVIGNSVHWIEEQGRCEESLSRRAVTNLVSSTKKAGGWVVNSGADLLNYFSEKD